MNKLKQQTVFPTDFYHLQPVDLSNPSFRYITMMHFNRLGCPFYAPVVPDGICRLCHCNSTEIIENIIYIQIMHEKYNLFFSSINLRNFIKKIIIFRSLKSLEINIYHFLPL